MLSLREDVKGMAQEFGLVMTWLYIRNLHPRKSGGASIGDVLLIETF